MNDLKLDEAPFAPVNRLSKTNSTDPRNKRVQFAIGIIAGIALLIFNLQFYGMLAQQKTDSAAMSDRIQQLEHDNHDLKSSMADQAKSTKSISAELELTKTKLESTRQDLSLTQADLVDTRKKTDSSQKEIVDLMKTEFDDQKTELLEFRREMTTWKQGYNTVLTNFTKKDEGYRNDIKLILQKIQSLDIGKINDKVFALQISVMDLEKKLIDQKKTPFDENSKIKKLEDSI